MPRTTTIDDNKQVFATNLDRLMRLRGLKNPWVGDRLQVSRQTVHQWRHGESSPSPLYRGRLCEVLNCTEDDLAKPLYAVNLKMLIEARKLDISALADCLNLSPAKVQEFLDGLVEPSGAILSGLSDVLDCTEKDILEAPNVLSLSMWAKREQIPITRAADLFDLGILTGGIKTPFGLLIPASIEAPFKGASDTKGMVTKQLVSSIKRWPRWGADAKDIFVDNLKTLMAAHNMENVVLAERMDVKAATISHWRSGLRTPEEANLQKLADIFGCDLDEMMTKHIKGEQR